MKIQPAYLIALLAFVNVPSFAQVQLLVDENIKVISINGHEVNRGLLQPLQKQFNLEAGRHAITARYDRLFNLNNNNHDYLKSTNITITVDLKNHQTYHLVMPNQPNTYSAAKEYAKSPSLAVSHQGNIIAQTNSGESEKQGLLQTLTGKIGGVFKKDSSDNTAIANQKAIPAIDDALQTPQNNLDGFMQIWLNASEEEREKIRHWIAK